MAIFETFAKRKRNAKQAGKPIIFQQDDLPETFRVQVVHIWRSTLGDPNDCGYKFHLQDVREEVWRELHLTLAREVGVFTLWPGANTHMNACQMFVLNSSDVDNVLSLIEISLRAAVNLGNRTGGSQTAGDAIDELNHRFREHAIGYQFQGGQIISVESQYLHSETVEPAISLLYDAQFEGPLQEFMQAHEHFRKGNHKDAIVNAQNAFESTMKAICEQRGWDYGTERATASKIIDVLFKNNLIPSEMQSHFAALRSTLESGLPTVRNQPGQGGHGQGADVVEVADYLAAYCLHLAATNIVLLIEAHNASK